MTTTTVFIVDDSAVVRQTLLHLLADEPGITCIGTAPNPLIAAPLLARRPPDVLLLDIEMPGMDGLTFLRQQMAQAPIPTVVCSTLTQQGSRVAVDALAAGAVAVIAKPRLGLQQYLKDARRELVQTLKAAAQAQLRHRPLATLATTAPPTATTSPLRALAVNKPVLLGSSTGGPAAIEELLMGLPPDAPGIAIVQHMPERFTAMYAQRLHALCPMSVREARDGDRLERGLVLIAPGGRHLQLRQRGGQYFMVVGDGPPVNRHRPAVDVLFRSAAECAGGDAMAVLLTGTFGG